MSHSYVSAYFHCIFGTKGRQPFIVPDIRERIWPYIGGIARQNRMNALAVGGTENHIHILLSLSSTLSIAKALQLIKGNSSKWVHDTFPDHRDFGWQEGYGAFSMSFSHLKDTIVYIQNQEKHHKKQTFEEEFVMFLKKTETKYDERYLWD